MTISRRTVLTLLRISSGTVLPGVVSEPGDAAIDERLELDLDQSQLSERAPHTTHAAEERRQAGVDEMIDERSAPPFGLGVEDAGDLGGD